MINNPGYVFAGSTNVPRGMSKVRLTLRINQQGGMGEKAFA